MSVYHHRLQQALPFLLAVSTWTLTPAFAQPRLCALEGEVVDSVTGTPIAQADVHLVTDVALEFRPVVEVKTHADGKFTFDKLSEGRYLLHADKLGYGLNRSHPRKSISYTGAQCISGIQLRIQADAVLKGRVLDEDGKPVARAAVAVSRAAYRHGEKSLDGFGVATSNDKGEYRVFGILPGRYLVAAEPPAVLIQAQKNPRELTAHETYGRTFYPRAIEPSAAAAIDFLPGSETPLDLTLKKRLTARVRGRVFGDLSAAREVDAYLYSPTGRYDARADSNGAFEFNGVMPGSYFLAALGTAGTIVFECGRTAVVVGDKDIEDLRLSVSPPLELHGKVSWAEEEPKPARLGGFRVVLISKDQDVTGIAAGRVPFSQVSDDGTFSLNGGTWNQYRVDLQGLPPDCYLQSARMAGRDVLNLGLDLSGGPEGNLELVVSAKAGSVAGSVTDKNDNPVAGATVVVIPRFSGRESRVEFHRVSQTDQNGLYSVRGLSPGDYAVHAWSEVESGMWMDPDFAARIGTGEKVTVREARSSFSKYRYI